MGNTPEALMKRTLRLTVSWMIFSPCVLSSPQCALAADRSQWDGIAVYNAETAVKARLRDSGSAQFKNVAAFRPAAARQAPQAVCGEVNSKNGFGGYAGYQVFVWIPLDANMKPDVENGTAFVGSEADNLRPLCHNKSGA